MQSRNASTSIYACAKQFQPRQLKEIFGVKCLRLKTIPFDIAEDVHHHPIVGKFYSPVLAVIVEKVKVTCLLLGF